MNNNCLYCGNVHRCRNYQNCKDCRNCAFFMKLATTDDVQRIAHCKRITGYKAWSTPYFKAVAKKFKNRNVQDKYYILVKGGEMYFRPKKISEEWQKEYFKEVAQ